MKKTKSKNHKLKNKNNKFNSKRKLSRKKRSTRIKTIKGGTLPSIPPSSRNAAAAADLPIGIISYNISWGSMTGDTGDRTGNVIAQYCADKSTEAAKKEKKEFQVGQPTICLRNIQKFFQTEVSDPRKNICFIGLQEAANWKNIWEDGGVLQRMGYVHNITTFKIINDGKEEEISVNLTSFYDARQFKVLGVKYGNLVNHPDFTPKDGRPFQIIFFKRKSNNKIYIFYL